MHVILRQDERDADRAIERQGSKGTGGGHVKSFSHIFADVVGHCSPSPKLQDERHLCEENYEKRL